MKAENVLTDWMWIEPWGEKENTKPSIVYFRKSFMVEEIPEKYLIHISADSRYKLYINGNFVQEGPSKGNAEIWYYDKAELLPFLRRGENIMAVEVLRYPVQLNKRNHSLHRTETPCLYVKECADAETGSFSLTSGGKKGWKCRLNEGITFRAEPFEPAPLHILEDVCGKSAFAGWKYPGYRDEGWHEAVHYSFADIMRRLSESPFNLTERTIPLQWHGERRFKGAVCVREGKTKKNTWNNFLEGADTVTVPAHTKEVVEVDAGELKCGYLELKMAGGAGSRISLESAESYAVEIQTDFGETIWRKKDRTDWKNGKIHGMKDRYCAEGYGNREISEEWESYWFRTFRFIRLEIETGDVPLTLLQFSYRESGYPLEVKTRVVTSDESLNAIWDISERTLRRCMHETYMDCPFYEQLSYAMDARLEILYTYAVSADDRLARKTMEDFRLSQRADGVLNSCAPSVRKNVIPGFSVYYILMVHDHMMYFGDRELVRLHFPAIDRILGFFDGHLNSMGMVGKVGGPHFRAKYWSFIDWTSQWQKTAGVPTACLKGSGSITMESLLYYMGLEKAAELAEFIGRDCVAREYRERAESLKNAVMKECSGEYSLKTGERMRLIQDGPGVEEYSVHCQVFAILNGFVSGQEGRKMLEAVLGKPELFAQCSVAMQHYLFRALEKVQWYEKSDDLWNLWRKMVAEHMTTCVENDTDARSDCHAWASAILYELPAVSLGVRPASPGFEKVDIRPCMGYLDFCKGDVVTPRGMIHVEWKRTGDTCHVQSCLY